MRGVGARLRLYAPKHSKPSHKTEVRRISCLSVYSLIGIRTPISRSHHHTNALDFRPIVLGSISVPNIDLPTCVFDSFTS
jgi:hypothetical protein